MYFYIINTPPILLVSNVPYRLIQKYAMGPDVTRILSAFSPSQPACSDLWEHVPRWGPRTWKELKLVHRGRGGSKQEALENTKAGRVSPSFSTWLNYLSLPFPPFPSPLYGSYFLLPHGLSSHGREWRWRRHWLEPVLAPSHFWVLQERILWAPVKRLFSPKEQERGSGLTVGLPLPNQSLLVALGKEDWKGHPELQDPGRVGVETGMRGRSVCLLTDQTSWWMIKLGVGEDTARFSFSISPSA